MDEEETILDEAERFVARYVVADDPVRWVMVLAAASTYALKAFPTIWRILFNSASPGAGKTTAMMVTALMSSNPKNAKGTGPGLLSALDNADAKEEGDPVSLYWDEAGTMFGDSGSNRPQHAFVTVCLEGYKHDATSTRSVRGTPKEFSIFAPVYMTAIGVGVPPDIRDRTIVLPVKKGIPQAYFSVRDGQSDARQLGEALKSAVMTVYPELKEFQGTGYHPQLTGRKQEVWEPLLAIAQHLGGQKWVNRCIQAFTELALNSSSRIALSPRQKMIKASAEILDGELSWARDAGFIPGDMLRTELRKREEYKDRTEAQVSRDLGDYLGYVTIQPRGLKKRDDRYWRDRMRGYPAQLITDLWEQVRPDELSDVEIPEPADPFAVTESDDGDFELLFGKSVPPAASGEDPTARPGMTDEVDAFFGKLREPADGTTGTTGTGARRTQRPRTRANAPGVEARFLTENALK